MSSKVLARIGDGILMGIGAGIVLAIAMYLQSLWVMSSLEGDDFGLPGYKSYGPDAGLSVKSHRPKPAAEQSSFIGEVANSGTDTWNHVRFVVELFGKDGAFVGKCTDSLDGPIGPGQVRNFEVSCSNCRNDSVPSFDRYTIEIVDAAYEQPISDV
jgi:hypothetical protein